MSSLIDNCTPTNSSKQTSPTAVRNTEQYSSSSNITPTCGSDAEPSIESTLYSNCSKDVNHSVYHCSNNLTPNIECSTLPSNVHMRSIESSSKFDESHDVKISVLTGLVHPSPAPEFSVLPSNDPERSIESTLSSNTPEGGEPPVYRSSVHANPAPKCCVLPNSEPVRSHNSTIIFDASKDMSVNVSSAHSNPALQSTIQPRSGPVESTESAFHFNDGGDVKTLVYFPSGHSSPTSTLVEKTVEFNGSASSAMNITQGIPVKSNAVSVVSRPRQSFHLSCDTNGYHKLKQSTVQPATAATPTSVTGNLLLINNDGHQAQYPPAELKPLSAQPVYFFSTNVIDTVSNNGTGYPRPTLSFMSPTSTQSTGSLVTNFPGLQLPRVIAHRIVHSDTNTLTTRHPSQGNFSSEILPSVNSCSAYRKILPKGQQQETLENANRSCSGIPSLGNLSSGNHFSSAHNKTLPKLQQQVTHENADKTPTLCCTGILPSGNRSSENQPLGNLSSGDLISGRISSEVLSSGNLSSAYRKVHPDFQHLANNAYATRLPLGKMSTPVGKLSSPVEVLSSPGEKLSTGCLISLNTTYAQPEGNPYKCSICLLRFSSEKEYKFHIPVHYRNCPYCSEVFNSRTPSMELLKHVVLFHKDKDPCDLVHRSTVESALRGSQPGQFRCCHCGDEFNSLRACLEHRVYSHMVKECWVCQKTFSTVSKLKDHIRTHTGERAWSCPHCSKSFASSRTLGSHMKRHTGTNVYRCEHCSFITAHKYSLETHKNIHTGARPFKCQHCPMTYGHPGRLKIHERTHTGEKPYGCEQCDRAFIDKYSLVRHVRTHTGEKPYKCGYCDKRFAQGCQLQFHERTHTGEKPFECSHCGKKFSRRQELTKHLATHEKRKSKRKMVDKSSDSDDVEDVEEDSELSLASLRSSKQSAPRQEVDVHLASNKKRKREAKGKNNLAENNFDSDDEKDEKVERDTRLASLRSSKTSAQKRFVKQLANRRKRKSKGKLAEHDSDSDDVEYMDQDREERLVSLRSSKQSIKKR